ncbi:hypothetical protein AB0O34_00030 [Sphaerisporangium sp. NPDC088356]|uniref:hypothetical protein n=1 Tax=Sphaerisporangium sp. NPDC088356 TaxID=3154871 RepID=UPI003445F8C6
MRELLVRRCQTWADERGMRAEGTVISAALDSRHHSRDGRLAFWGPGEVRRLLLEWIPRQVIADREVLDAAPESLLTLLSYLAASGLRDPRGSGIAELEKSVTEVAAEYPDALADPLRQGIGKFWAQTALENGVDLTDQRSLEAFQCEITAGHVRYDQNVLDNLMQAHFLQGEHRFDQERALAQPPVALPPAAELAGAAAQSRVVWQLTTLADWVGADGRQLTAAGHPKLGDARELAGLLGTEEQEMKVRSSAEMRRVGLLLAWAKKARLLRVSKGRLLRVAKAAPILRDPQALWSRAFEVFFDLGAAIGAPATGWSASSMLVETFDEVLPDVLNSAHGMPSPVPLARLQETVWLACYGYFMPDAGDDLRAEFWRRQVGRDLLMALEILSELGVVELSHGVPDELYSSDLGWADQPLPPEARARLLRSLAEPGLLIELTPLGLSAVRERMLVDGRDVPLLGELAAAPPAELLGVLAQHYPPEQAAVELEGWLAAHGGDVESLLDAVRACPFRTRTAAMLATLVEARADGRSLLTRSRRDPVLGPIAVTDLLDAGELRPEDLTSREHLLLLAEGLLVLLELGGPEAVMEQLGEMAGKDALGMIEAVLSSGHSDRAALEELRTLVGEPMRTRAHRLRLIHSPAPGSRGRHGGARKKRKR